MSTEKEKKALPASCKALKTNVQSNGAPLDRKAAADVVTNYLQGVNDPSGSDHNFGYLFGLDQVRWFIGGIDVYNNGKTPDKQIQGVRVYLGRKTPVQSGQVLSMEKIMDTLFLMPVLADGTDLYKVHQILPDDTILGDPRPCPNECKALSFLTS